MNLISIKARRFGLGALAILASAAGSQELVAQAQFCTAHEKMEQWLAVNSGQSRKAVAIDVGHQLVEIYASREDGTWTITVTAPEGRTCIIGEGTAFEFAPDAFKPGIDG